MINLLSQTAKKGATDSFFSAVENNVLSKDNTAPQKKKLFTGLDHVYLIFLGSLNPNIWSV